MPQWFQKLQNCEKIRKMSQHSAPRPKNRKKTIVLGGMREAQPEGASLRKSPWGNRGINLQHAEGSETPAHCDAKRVGEATRGSQNQSSLAEISKRRLSKNLQIAVPTRFFPTGSAQERPKDFQHPPKSFPNPSKIDPRSIPKPFWSPSCTHAGKKIDLERPKSGQEAPKSAQKTTQTVPNPS